MKEKVNLLDVIPFREERIMAEKDGNLCVLALPRFKNAWIRKHLIPKNISPYIRVTLEEHGSAVWKLIDGKRTVREIILESGEHFGYEENYDVRVTNFIIQLRKDKLIRYYIQ